MFLRRIWSASGRIREPAEEESVELVRKGRLVDLPGVSKVDASAPGATSGERAGPNEHLLAKKVFLAY